MNRPRLKACGWKPAARPLLDVLRDRGVDGIIHAAVLRNDPSIASAAEDGLPAVALNHRVENSAIPSIINDEDAGICEMLRHLRDLGHRRIAHIAGPQTLSTGQFRLAAFHRAVEQYGAGQAAARTLLRLLNEEQPGEAPIETILPMKLVVRDSTAPALSQSSAVDHDGHLLGETSTNRRPPKPAFRRSGASLNVRPVLPLASNTSRRRSGRQLSFAPYFM